jgi:hypothetical protein
MGQRQHGFCTNNRGGRCFRYGEKFEIKRQAGWLIGCTTVYSPRVELMLVNNMNFVLLDRACKVRAGDKKTISSYAFPSPARSSSEMACTNDQAAVESGHNSMLGAKRTNHFFFPEYRLYLLEQCTTRGMSVNLYEENPLTY